ncbi:hypothetical protein SPSIL_057530 [Sporomusa silvacetica DSM 10669]|uniref:Uncharacterized protein n=1 Tax=Sporomusa silvacetica DSM 10669 TaxID=1123289 RepID=A0ABZ3IUW9_9FIRM|nr:hypothetical protein SPSIL_50260 [Sporomusa silvacetica DSM 10669]
MKGNCLVVESILCMQSCGCCIECKRHDTCNEACVWKNGREVNHDSNRDTATSD